MRVVYLTAGAAGMICGSCLRDNTLARALSRAGVDIELVPTYTPIRTDEPDASGSRVFLGGLNVYFDQKIPGFAWLPNWLTGWLDRPGLLRWATSFGIQTDARDLGALTVSLLRGHLGRQRREIERLVGWLASRPACDIVHFSNLMIGGCIPRLKERLGCRVVVTLQGDDIFLDELPPPYREQAEAEMRRLVTDVDRFVVNCRFYGDAMSRRFNIPPDKLEVQPLTIDTADFAGERPERTGSERVVGYLARLAPEKGLAVLIDGFLALRSRPGTEQFRMRIAGWMGDHRRTFVDEQKSKLRAAGLECAVEFVGELNRREKVEFLRGIDLLSVPATYDEPKGLYVLEALAAGTPYVQPARGAFPEIHERLGGGLLVASNDPISLADGWETLLRDDNRRTTLGREGQAAVQRLASSSYLTERMLATYGSLLG
jgi:glycosyltransferase involved in cell wall biosynthesis